MGEVPVSNLVVFFFWWMMIWNHQIPDSSFPIESSKMVIVSIIFGDENPPFGDENPPFIWSAMDQFNSLQEKIRDTLPETNRNSTWKYILNWYVSKLKRFSKQNQPFLSGCWGVHHFDEISPPPPSFLSPLTFPCPRPSDDRIWRQSTTWTHLWRETFKFARFKFVFPKKINPKTVSCLKLPPSTANYFEAQLLQLQFLWSKRSSGVRSFLWPKNLFPHLENIVYHFSGNCGWWG